MPQRRHALLAFVLLGILSLGSGASSSSAASSRLRKPAVVAAPVITGAPVQATTLSMSTGAWSGQPTAYAYRWSDCTSAGSSCVSITGATSSTYTLRTSDVGHALRALVTATNSRGSTTAQSAPTAVVQAGTSSTVVGGADVTPPSVPANEQQSAATQTSATLTWAASSDNVGVAGYSLWLDGIKIATTTATSYTYAGLVCGTSHTAGLQAFDAAGNVSNVAQATGPLVTSACTDTQAPSVPAGFGATGSTQTSVSVGWTASTDNVGVAGYTVYNGAGALGTTSATSFTVSGLACGTTSSLSVDAFDAAGNHSSKATVSASTSACSGGGGAATANLWVGPSGGSCTRSATPVAYSASTACATVAAAWAAAQGGDTILVVGSAGGQLYTSGFSASGAKSSTVTISVPSGQSAWFAGDGSLQNVTNMLVTDDQPVDLASRSGVGNGLTMGVTDVSGSSANIAFNNVDLWCQEQAPWHLVNGSTGSKCSARLLISGVNGFTMTGGSIGPITDCITACSGATDINKVSGCPSNAACSNITFRHVWFHDNRRLDSNVHSEMWKLDQGHNITIDGSLFTNCGGCSSAAIMFGQNGSNPTVDSFTLENSVIPAGQGSPSLRWGYCAGNCAPAVTLLYNTFEGSVSICDAASGCTGISYANFLLRGNTAWNQAFGGCLSGATYDHNSWYTDSASTNVARCTGDNAGNAGLNLTSVYTSPGSPNYDYHMLPTAPSNYAGAGGTNCTGLTDLYGQPRPLNGTCDVGAVEK
jgi:chitodextrinase